MKFYLLALIAAASEFPVDFENNGQPDVEVSRIPDNVLVDPDFIDYVAPPSFAVCKDLLCETFQQGHDGRWTNLSRTYDGNVAFEGAHNEWVRGQKRAVLKDGMKYHGMAAELRGTWQPSSRKPFAFSMDVRFPSDHTCGGGYVKLFNKETVGALSNFDSEDNYSIMFGPDRCGDTRKVHFIVQYNGPDGTRVEEHLSQPVSLPSRLDVTHQYGFVLYPNSTLQIFVNGEEKLSGNLKDLTTPGFKSNDMIDDPEDPVPEGWMPAPETIPDESAVKPDDWDEDAPEMIVDETAVKPEGWLDDEPLMVPNMSVEKPDDWDDEEDGEWRRPLKKNPKCYEVGCGEWKKPMINNPNYRGKWERPQIPNPDYVASYQRRQIKNPYPYDHAEPFEVVEHIDAVGFELWVVENNTALDNIWVGTDKDRLLKWAEETWRAEHELEMKNVSRAFSKEQPTEEKKSESKERLLKMGIAAIIITVIVVLAVRKLVGMTCCPTSQKKVEEKKTAEVQETEQEKEKAKETASGETQPKKRAN